MPTEPAEIGQTAPAESGRRHRRRGRQVPARQLTEAERAELLTIGATEALGRFVAVASWLTNADAPVVVAMRELVAMLEPAPSGQRDITGAEMPGPKPPVAERLRIIDAYLSLLADQGGTARGRAAAGIVLVPATDPTSVAPGRAPRRRKPTFAIA